MELTPVDLSLLLAGLYGLALLLNTLAPRWGR
jgi:hypothetical protein